MKTSTKGWRIEEILEIEQIYIEFLERKDIGKTERIEESIGELGMKRIYREQIEKGQRKKERKGNRQKRR